MPNYTVTGTIQSRDIDNNEPVAVHWYKGTDLAKAMAALVGCASNSVPDTTNGLPLAMQYTTLSVNMDITPLTDEQWREQTGITVEWEDDWSVGSHVKEYGDAYNDEPETCHQVVVKRGNDVLAALGCVDNALIVGEDGKSYLDEVAANLIHEARIAAGEVNA